MPPEEIEYLVDVNHRLLFYDLTKVKIVPEGLHAVKRICIGLENHGDIPSLFRMVKTLEPPEFRQLEEQIGIVPPGPKKIIVELFIQQYYTPPDSIIEYVATRGFSAIARELFDIVWQSKEGVLTVSKIRNAHRGSEYEVEQEDGGRVAGCRTGPDSAQKR